MSLDSGNPFIAHNILCPGAIPSAVISKPKYSIFSLKKEHFTIFKVKFAAFNESKTNLNEQIDIREFLSLFRWNE